MSKQANWWDRFWLWVDAFQQRHRLLAIPHAVIKKYGDDDAGHKVALLAYYGFASLFPLLIVATSIINLLSQHHQALRDHMLQSVSEAFPAIGMDLQSTVHPSNKTGLGLAIGILVTLYGARGIANAIRYAMDRMWHVPRSKRPGFPKNILINIGLVLGGGAGILLAGFLSSYATIYGHSFAWKILVSLASLSILFWTFCFLFRYATASAHKLHDNFPGAIVAAASLQILQTIGGYLVTHELKNLNGLNAQFAVVLALLFWLYLQAQIFLYAAEVNTVRTLHLWPRSLTGKLRTPADEKASQL